MGMLLKGVSANKKLNHLLKDDFSFLNDLRKYMEEVINPGIIQITVQEKPLQ